MSYREFIALANKYYHKGGAGYVHMSKEQFDTACRRFGGMTKDRAMKLFAAHKALG